MNLLPLAALPAATLVARDAVAGGAQMGKSFFSLLSNWTQNSGDATPSTVEEAAGQPDSKAASAGPAPDSVTQRTRSFSQRLGNWLRQQPWLKNSDKGDGPDAGPLTIELTLDQLDRPHATLGGQPNEQLDAALASDPSWLEEFRHLALDRTEQVGTTSASSATQYLTIALDSATMDTEHQWK